MCLADADRGLLYTGDHVLRTIPPGLGVGGDGDRNARDPYLGTIPGLLRFADHQICPGHEFRFYGLSDRLAEIVARHQSRRVCAHLAVARGTATTWEVASQLESSAGWGGLKRNFPGIRTSADRDVISRRAPADPAHVDRSHNGYIIKL